MLSRERLRPDSAFLDPVGERPGEMLVSGRVSDLVEGLVRLFGSPGQHALDGDLDVFVAQGEAVKAEPTLRQGRLRGH